MGAMENTDPVFVSVAARTARISSLKQAQAAVLEGVTIERKRNRLRIMVGLEAGNGKLAAPKRGRKETPGEGLSPSLVERDLNPQPAFARQALGLLVFQACALPD